MPAALLSSTIAHGHGRSHFSNVPFLALLLAPVLCLQCGPGGIAVPGSLGSSPTLIQSLDMH